MAPSTVARLLLILSLGLASSALRFNFSSFDQNPQCSNGDTTDCILFQNDTFFNQGIQLTKNEVGNSLSDSIGRAVYSEPLLLWDSNTGELTDFTTHFSFKINAFNQSLYGDGLAFFLSPYPAVVPNSSAGGSLGIFDSRTNTNTSANRLVAVEFDSFQNQWDPSNDHVGINVNSIDSVATVLWNSSIKDGRMANAWVSYNATSHNLTVFLTYRDNPIFSGNSTLSHVVDLRQILPDHVAIGFSAATGSFVETHTIFSWDFSSTLDVEKKKSRAGLLVGLAVGVGVLFGVAGLVWFLLWRKKARRLSEEDESYDFSIDDEFEKGRGPKRFTYAELATATKNFSDDGKLGEGGFGAVYHGLLRDPDVEVAVKRVSRGSKQGRKEYVSEVRIISRLRHRNLVQLVGWCHGRGEFMLVYEFMPNGSLDAHLYNKERLLPWPLRHKIALEIASGLLYLHEEWEQCVVHRDIKPSNVMLDALFNAKLGDFGLARLVDHERGSQTTILAGTMGYLAPECVTTGKASKESDVYSFGVVALEMACGRRPVEPKERPGRIALVEWVWDLYGRMTILEAADERLGREFDEQQMERLMVVGLWCAHPDSAFRPSIKQAISVLNSDAPLPHLPSKMPVPMYFAPPMDALQFTYTSSSTGVSSNTTGSASIASVATNSSTSSMSPGLSDTSYLLKEHKTNV